MIETLDSKKVVSPTLHVTISITIAGFITAIVIACVFKVEVVSRGQGKIVPVSRVQVVQPEFGGAITAIHVSNGSVVREGDVLIELDATAVDAELNMIADETVRLRIERARLSDLSRIANEEKSSEEEPSSAFSALQMAVFDEGLDLKHHYYEEQRRLLKAETADLQAALVHIAGRIEANDKSIAVTEASITRIDAALETQRERMTAASELLEKGVSTRMAFLDVQDATTALEKEREIYVRELDQKRSQGTTLRAERRRIGTEQIRRILRRTSEIEARMATLDERYRTAHRQRTAARLVAPKSGVVEQLDVYTLGAIARAGQQLLRIVPEDQDIIIEGMFTNADIGFIENGQQANINLAAYPSSRFGFVKGAVSQVAADATEVASGIWAFEVRITPDEPVLRKGDLVYPLRPGMTATIDVTTDKRRIITYFFAPIVETIQAALGER